MSEQTEMRNGREYAVISSTNSERIASYARMGREWCRVNGERALRNAQHEANRFASMGWLYRVAELRTAWRMA